MSIQGKNPATGSSVETCPNLHRRTAFLLRPVSKNSDTSGHGHQHASFDLSGLFPIDKPISPSTRAAIAAAVEAAGGPPARVQNRAMRSGLLATRTLSTGEMHQGQGLVLNIQQQLIIEFLLFYII
jgi:hypothetical protein